MVGGAAVGLWATARRPCRLSRLIRPVSDGFAGGYREGDAVEHLLQAGEITVLHGCAAGLVVDGAGDLLPVELEAGIVADPVPEQAGGSAVAFSERMPVVPLVIVDVPAAG